MKSYYIFFCTNKNKLGACWVRGNNPEHAKRQLLDEYREAGVTIFDMMVHTASSLTMLAEYANDYDSQSERPFIPSAPVAQVCEDIDLSNVVETEVTEHETNQNLLLP